LNSRLELFCRFRKSPQGFNNRGLAGLQKELEKQRRALERLQNCFNK